MRETDLKYFKLLKGKITLTFIKSYAASTDIKDWKGQDISDFQNDLSEKVQGRISEKWFYTHLKTDSEKLPRIDMLNLLSKYAGYQNWADFKIKEKINSLTLPVKQEKTKITPWLLGLILLAVTLILYALYPSSSSKEYQFCFIDADRGMPITHPIEIFILNNGESPIHQQCDSIGCISIHTEKTQLSFVVKSSYYKTDTITRIIKNPGSEHVKLKTNDYALMIHIFSNSKIQDWKKRRTQLSEMIAESAQIYQIGNDKNIGLELYNKKEFINKMTMPVNSLKNIEILETIYQNDQIIKMRFRQQTSK